MPALRLDDELVDCDDLDDAVGVLASRWLHTLTERATLLVEVPPDDPRAEELVERAASVITARARVVDDD